MKLLALILIIILLAGCSQAETREAKCERQAEELGATYLAVHEGMWDSLADEWVYGCWVRLDGIVVNLWAGPEEGSANDK